MGIPFYFKSILNRHHNIVYPSSKIKKCANLFLDFNCIVHQAANAIVSKPAHAALQGRQLTDVIIRDTIAYVDKIKNTVNPTDLLYIAVDGPCPRAKMLQQRKRRFVSAWRNQKLAHLHAQQGFNTYWDSNIITPGTDFMSILNQKMAEYCVHCNSVPGPKVILADSTEFGEGEHKIFKFMNAQSASSKGKLNVIYGLDADLIMLSLIHSDPVHLLREVPEFQLPIEMAARHDFLILDVPMLKNSIVSQYALGTEPHSDAAEAFIKDYMLICALLGNDFLPPLSYLKIKHNAIEYLMELYISTREQVGQNLVTSSNSLNTQFICTLLSNVAKNEDTNMKEMYQVYLSRRPYFDRKHTSPLASASFELDNYPAFHKSGHEIDPTNPGWRMRYYESLFSSHSSQTVTKACTAYVDGIRWILDYYFTHDPPLNWYYPYNFSPTALDLSNHLQIVGVPSESTNGNLIESSCNMTNHEFKTLMKNQYMQLVMVLPPQSKHLLPARIQALMTHIEYNCVHYYPVEFRICTFLKYYLWECSPLLPDINIQHLHNCLQRVEGEATR